MWLTSDLYLLKFKLKPQIRSSVIRNLGFAGSNGSSKSSIGSFGSWSGGLILLVVKMVLPCIDSSFGYRSGGCYSSGFVKMALSYIGSSGSENFTVTLMEISFWWF